MAVKKDKGLNEALNDSWLDSVIDEHQEESEQEAQSSGSGNYKMMRFFEYKLPTVPGSEFGLIAFLTEGLYWGFHTVKDKQGRFAKVPCIRHFGECPYCSQNDTPADQGVWLVANLNPQTYVSKKDRKEVTPDPQVNIFIKGKNTIQLINEAKFSRGSLLGTAWQSKVNWTNSNGQVQNSSIKYSIKEYDEKTDKELYKTFFQPPVITVRGAKKDNLTNYMGKLQDMKTPYIEVDKKKQPNLKDKPMKLRKLNFGDGDEPVIKCPFDKWPESSVNSVYEEKFDGHPKLEFDLNNPEVATKLLKIYLVNFPDGYYNMTVPPKNK